jgi:glucosamine--fructose-6-phosphate aminotransferase (isomerizing)
MCGIVGLVSRKPVKQRLQDGLKRLEYRGYDSAGAAFFDHGVIVVKKVVGGIDNLAQAISAFDGPEHTIGIVHTRWATHGEVGELNAHPHEGCRGAKPCKAIVVLVHNGTVDNYAELRDGLLERGHTLRSETDTELIAHLIGEVYDGDPLRAIRNALSQVQGTYGLAILFENDPDHIYFARLGSPLVLGISDEGTFVASDALAFREYTDQMVELEDGCLGWISADQHHVIGFDDVPMTLPVQTVPYSLESADQGTHEHFMAKEIAEQPRTLQNGMRGRLLPDGSVKLGGLEAHADLLRSVRSHGFVGAGTSLNACMVAEILIQEIAELPAFWKNASELANQKCPRFRNYTAFWGFSQSGETMDLIQALDTIQRCTVPCFGIVNRVGSAIARKAGRGVYIHAGMEVAVASTKAYTNQVLTLTLIALYLRQLHHLPRTAWIDRLVADLQRLPTLAEQLIAREDQVIRIAERYAGYPNFLYLGRGINYPTALEGALKLKEIAYINAIGYSTGEMKHGPIALIDGGFPTMVVAPKQDDYYAHILTNVQQIRARHGRLVAVATDGDGGIQSCVDDVLWVPPIDYFLTPLLMVIPLQQFAYHVARIRGLNPDRPRNLAKSVTVK